MTAAAVKFRVATALLFCATFCKLGAQVPTATLVGTVMDPSGALVTGAKIEVRHSGTNEIRKAQSDQRGEFTVPNLSPGIYNVSIAKDGFRTLEETGLQLQLEQAARMDFRLQLGSLAEKVEIIASAPLVNTENGEKGEVMVSQEIAEMPLDGRDFTSLALLTPGVSATNTFAGGYGSFAAINGARPDNTNFVIDGSNNQSPRNGQPAMHPNIDAIQEFKMQTSGYSAEFGRFAGGVVNAVLKSGGNQVHGALFEFWQNDLLNARNFFAQSKPELRVNQFGGLVSGPVLIPKVYNGRNRTFFLFSWESSRRRSGVSGVTAVPTAAMRQGGFSGFAPLKDPLASGTFFPNNQIPVSRMSAPALAIQAYWPTPNQTGPNNFYNLAASRSDWDSDVIKIDQRFGSRDSLSFRYTKRYDRSVTPFTSGDNLVTAGQTSHDHVTLGGLTYTRVFTPSLINEARFAYTRTPTAQLAAYQGVNYNQQFGMAGGPTDPYVIGFPNILITGYPNIGPAASLPSAFTLNSFDTSDTMTWVKGVHLIKFGLGILRTQYFSLNANNSRGNYDFTGSWTGLAYADFMLGYLNDDSIAYGTTRSYLRNYQDGFFFQDDWKVSSRLTLNLGMRYELLEPMHDKYDRWTNFIPQLNKLVVASFTEQPPAPRLSMHHRWKPRSRPDYRLRCTQIIRTSRPDLAWPGGPLAAIGQSSAAVTVSITAPTR